jgi:hypothetical protein
VLTGRIVWRPRMWKCGCDYSYWCFDAGQCGWTNNPIMYNRQWWTDTFVRVLQCTMQDVLLLLLKAIIDLL